MTRLPAPLHRALANGSLYAVLAALGFSFKAIFVKLAYAAGPVDAISLLALRMALSLPLFAWLVWASRGQGGAPLSAGDGLRVALLGLFGYYLASLFDFYGLQFISAGLERLILFTYPTLVLVIQAVVQRERPTLRTLAAMGLCYLGLGIAFVHDIASAGTGNQVLVGSLWVFASAVTYALYYSGTGMMLKRMNSMRLAGLCGSASSLMVLAHYLLVADVAPLLQLPSAVWLNAALMALFSTVLPIYWVALAIQRMGPTHTAAVGNLGPVLTMLASWLILSEAVSLYQVAGLVLVLFGVSRLKPAKKPEAQAAAPARSV
ncbi:DMT family transporter [Pseudomonas mosselii]|uniref:DMT family transporter n=1 Tax=Pseudomonas mosselii TaxID=78327 RepID=A0ABX9AVY8_9PSED|nr:DMT family transporter [Pseudomonas mosselii]AMK31585.1 Permease of the drug/metabolite transporter (DMT) superfamily [Pseudomonas putida]MBC3452895.1 DMT family transporter [Pseudomonas mosselii]MBH3311988.1 DMT family transporter [Pseudomonas mosselii]MBH3325991.1 DMT family transporter [Pseudomonas mosselii]MCU9532312.1 DMT family transporter [Pseudomonas mosselii]